MSRPRKPSALLELSGAYRKNPSRRRPPAPEPAGPLGDPPERLQGEARMFWYEIVNALAAGVLTCADRWCVELAAMTMAKAVRIPDPAVVLELARAAELSAEETKTQIRQQAMTGAHWTLLRSLLGAMGMTPADRSKLSIPAEKPKNKFEDLARDARKG